MRTDPDQAAEDFAWLVLEMHEAEGVEETVDAVVDYALQALTCDYAGVALQAAGGRPEVPAVTDPVVAEIYRFQMAGADGPLVECMRARATVSVPDLVGPGPDGRTARPAPDAAGVSRPLPRCCR
jgi:hypothetical protein